MKPLGEDLRSATHLPLTTKQATRKMSSTIPPAIDTARMVDWLGSPIASMSAERKKERKRERELELRDDADTHREHLQKLACAAFLLLRLLRIEVCNSAGSQLACFSLLLSPFLSLFFSHITFNSISLSLSLSLSRL